jgi:hypothetical protein
MLLPAFSKLEYHWANGPSSVNISLLKIVLSPVNISVKISLWLIFSYKRELLCSWRMPAIFKSYLKTG